MQLSRVVIWKIALVISLGYQTGGFLSKVSTNCVDRVSQCSTSVYHDVVCKDDTTAITFCQKSCGKCPVDGGYSTWLPWSDCSVSCGGPGQSFRVRTCDNPKPQYNGQPCQGQKMELKTCDNVPCSGVANPCTPNPCVHGSCTAAGSTYSCNCNPGYLGNTCNIRDPCLLLPCIHGTCSATSSSGFHCQCTPGYTGVSCDTDINECQSNPCNNGVCVDEINGYRCNCNPGYTGPHCQTEIDECQSRPCSYHGICLDQVNGYTCRCLPGYTGKQCTTDINECLSTPCLNGGICHDEQNSFTCSCMPGYNGPTCSQKAKVRDCKDVLDYGLGSHDGIYNVELGSSKKDVVCDMATAGGGWTNAKHIILLDIPHTVHPDAANAERSSKRGYKQLYRGNTQAAPAVGTKYCDCENELVGNGIQFSYILKHVILYREDNHVDFHHHGFNDYALGFGNKHSDFWQGLEDIMHSLTSDGRRYQLRVDLRAANGTQYYEIYDDFNIGPSRDFTLHVGNHRGTAGDSLSGHSMHSFTTSDRDVDTNAGTNFYIPVDRSTCRQIDKSV